MERLEKAYEEASLWPKNLICSDIPALLLVDTFRGLESQAFRLFCDSESKAVVDLLERPCEDRGIFRPSAATIVGLETDFPHRARIEACPRCRYFTQSTLVSHVQTESERWLEDDVRISEVHLTII